LGALAPEVDFRAWQRFTGACRPNGLTQVGFLQQRGFLASHISRLARESSPQGERCECITGDKPVVQRECLRVRTTCFASQKNL
jgi:hypothetical protein